MCCEHSQSTECWKHFSYTGYDLLNEVTRLKKILFSIAGICCMLSGCGIASSNSGQTNHAAEMDEVQNLTLPDLTAFGIDTNQFSLSSEQFTQEFSSSNNLFFQGEKPYYIWNQYTNSAGAEIAVDDQGRLRKYLSHNDRGDAGEKLPKETYNEIAHKVIQCCVDSDADFEDSEESVICEQIGSVFYPCELYMKHSYAEGFSDLAYVSLNADGTVRTIEVSYCDIDFETMSASEIASAFEQQFQMYLDKARDHTIPENAAITDTHQYYGRVGDEIYCCCTYTIGIPVPVSGYEDEPVKNAEQVILKL